MKTAIIKYLNKIEVKDFLVYSNTDNGKFSWNINMLNENFNINISNSEYEENKIQLSLHNNYNNFKILVERQEVKIFINTLRKKLENEWCKKNVSEDKREELINIFKHSKNIDKFLKESFTKIEENEEKKFFFRSFEKPHEKKLQQLKFYHFYATEMSRDKRLTNEFYSTKDYEFLISNEELCEIFNIDLEKEKKEFFTKNFGFILKVGEKVSEEIKKEVTTEDVVTETISNKIKKFL